MFQPHVDLKTSGVGTLAEQATTSSRGHPSLPTTPKTPAISSPVSDGFSAFATTSSPFGKVEGTGKSFSNLLKTSDSEDTEEYGSDSESGSFLDESLSYDDLGAHLKPHELSPVADETTLPLESGDEGDTTRSSPLTGDTILCRDAFKQPLPAVTPPLPKPPPASPKVVFGQWNTPESQRRKPDLSKIHPISLGTPSTRGTSEPAKTPLFDAPSTPGTTPSLFDKPGELSAPSLSTAFTPPQPTTRGCLFGEQGHDDQDVAEVTREAHALDKATESPTVHPVPNPSIPFKPEAPACRRLISLAFSAHEVTSLIEAIFKNEAEVRAVRGLSGDAAQTFINVVHKVRPAFLRFLGTA